MPGTLRAAPAVAVLVGVLASGGCSVSAPAAAPPTAADPSPAPTQPLLATDDDHSRVGALAPGFPSSLFQVPAGATILVSSAQPQGSGLQISLNLRSTLAAGALLATVTAPLVTAGFTQTTPPQPDAGLAAQATFARSDGAELVVVGVRDDGPTRTLTAGGTITPPAAG